MTSPTQNVRVLWGANDRDRTPVFIAAWSMNTVVYRTGDYLDGRRTAEVRNTAYHDPAGGPWSYWTTDEAVRCPEAPAWVDA